MLPPFYIQKCVLADRWSPGPNSKHHRAYNAQSSRQDRTCFRILYVKRKQNRAVWRALIEDSPELWILPPL
ncbi:hypothetical protein GDO78_017260 [Eleutherodactylus coqui]|uniref:Uncharacterized protein n=1 Tax=Eleutherodactylus coqui TaxID=57060 RepID=A0A8J6BMZ2_ELECQ|nr:hypothetical protein GDO78_017260 [Eleutherodactylus coqui]